MMKTAWLLLVLALAFPAVVSADTSSAPTDTPSVDEKADLERLRLENENLKLKLQLMELQKQATPQAVPGTPTAVATATATPKPKVKPSEEDILKGEVDKNIPLAAAHKEDAERVIVDFFGNELWYKGIRYSGKYLQDMAKDAGWKWTDKIVAMDGWSRARHLYQFKNISFLIYDGREKGVVQIDAPQNPGDLDFLTSQGLSFASTEMDIRNADFSIFYKYDGMDDGDKGRVLKFKHDRFLSFGEGIEFYLNRQGRLVKVRFGVLGEK